MASQVVRLDGLRSLAAGSITPSFTAIGTAFLHGMRLLKIVNNTNADVIISFDGVIDNDFLPANSFALYDCNTNKNLPDSRFVFQNYTTAYARSTGAPSTGAVYVVCIFGRGE